MWVLAILTTVLLVIVSTWVIQTFKRPSKPKQSPPPSLLSTTTTTETTKPQTPASTSATTTASPSTTPTRQRSLEKIPPATLEKAASQSKMPTLEKASSQTKIPKLEKASSQPKLSSQKSEASTLGNIGNWTCKSSHTISPEMFVLYIEHEGEKRYLTKASSSPLISTDTDASKALRFRKHTCFATPTPQNIHWVLEDEQFTIRYGRHRGLGALSLQLERRKDNKDGHWDTWQLYNAGGQGSLYYSVSNSSYLRYKPKDRRFDPTSKVPRAVTICEEIVP